MVSTNTYGLIIVGILFIIASSLLYIVACYHKRRLNRRKLNDSNGVFNLGKSLNSVGFHRYNEINEDDVEDEENSINNDKSLIKNKKNTSTSSSSRFSKFISSSSKSTTPDNKKLLFTDDDDDDDDDDKEDKIFIR